MPARTKVLVGAVLLAVVGTGVAFFLTADERAFEEELERRYGDCPSGLAEPLPASSDVGLSDGELTLEHIADVAAVTAVVEDPRNGELLITEQTGAVKLVDPEGDVHQLLDLSDQIALGGSEQGLLGAAYTDDGEWLYLDYTATNDDTVVEAYPVEGRELGEPVEVLRVEQPHHWHNAGTLIIDRSQHLWITLGDGGLEADRTDQSQDPTTLLGSVLRLDISGGPDAARHADGNPFLDGGGAPEVWAYGLRNPWRIWVDEDAGHVVIPDVGDACFEEINVVPMDQPGTNFGWRNVEGPWVIVEPAPQDAWMPRLSYPRATNGCAVIGGVPTDPERYPSLEGAYVFADFCANELLALDLDGEGPAEAVGVGVPGVTSFGLAADGTVYVGTAADGLFALR